MGDLDRFPCRPFYGVCCLKIHLHTPKINDLKPVFILFKKTLHRHLHLHVISADLCTPTMKVKKHYNSFHPKLGFFLSLDDVLSWFDAEPSQFRTVCLSNWGGYGLLLPWSRLPYTNRIQRVPVNCVACTLLDLSSKEEPVRTASEGRSHLLPL